MTTTTAKFTIPYGNGATQDVDVEIDATEQPPGQATFSTFAHQVGKSMAQSALLQFAPGPVVPSLAAHVPSLPPTAVAMLNPTPIFDDLFTGPEKWGGTWGDDWFGGERFNGLTLDPTLITFLPGGGVQLATSNNGSTGCLMQTNPGDPLNPGFVSGYCYDETDAIISPKAPWATIWRNGAVWPTDGEEDIVEAPAGAQTTNYHGPASPGGSTDAPQNYTVPPGLGQFIGVRCKFGVLRVKGVSYRYWTLPGGPPTLVHQFNTTDGGAPQYLLLSIGNASGGGDGTLTAYRRTVWALA